MRSAIAILVLVLCTSPKVGALTLTPDSAWRNPVIPVCWEEPDPAHKQERQLVRKSIRLSWESESALRFTGWRACKTHSDGIRIVTGTSYPRTIARGRFVDGLARGMVLPELWGLAALSVNLKAPVHEFGHALGFGHEHARPDAPDPKRCGITNDDGSRYSEPDVALTPFDEDSVMVACVATATVRMSLGVPRLSAGDIFGLVQTYGSHPDHVLDRDEPGDRFGAALALADMDGDGEPDLAVGAPGEDDGKGAVYLYRGDKRRGFRPMQRLDASDFTAVNASEFGAALTWTSSSADGLGRLQIGSREGVISFLYKPRRRKTLVPDRVTGPLPVGISKANTAIDSLPGDGRFNFPQLLNRDDSLTMLRADLNHDGFEDLVVGAPFSDGNAVGSGTVTILRGVQRNGSIAHLPWYWFGQSY